MFKLLNKSKAFWIYFFSTLINQMIPFMLLPVLTKHLSVEDYGKITFFQTILVFTIPFIHMSLSRQIDKYFFSKDKEYISTLVFQILVIFCLMTCMVILLLRGVMFFVDLPFDSIWLYALVFVALFSSINTVVSVLFRNLSKPYHYGVFFIMQTLINIGLTLLLVVNFDFNYIGRFLGIIVSALFVAFIGLLYINKHNWVRMDFNFLGTLSVWKKSLPMILFGVATVVVTMSDVVFVEQMCSVEVLGIYSIGLLFGKSIMLVQRSVTNVSEPWILRQISSNEKEARFKIIKFIYLYSALIIALVFVLTFISKIAVTYMVDVKFHDGAKFIFWIMLGYAFRCLQIVYTPFIIYKDKTKFMAINTTIAAILNVFLNYFFISMYGAIGAAYATIITLFISYVITLIYVHSIYPLPYMQGLSRSVVKTYLD